MAEASPALASALQVVSPPGVLSLTEPRLLTIPEAAKYLSSTVWAVRTLIWENQIPYVRLGKKQLLDRVDLDEYICSIKIDKRKQKIGKRSASGCDMKVVSGDPDPKHVSTSFIERQKRLFS